jgi:hypothetical protein
LNTLVERKGCINWLTSSKQMSDYLLKSVGITALSQQTYLMALETPSGLTN